MKSLCMVLHSIIGPICHSADESKSALMRVANKKSESMKNFTRGLWFHKLAGKTVNIFLYNWLWELEQNLCQFWNCLLVKSFQPCSLKIHLSEKFWLRNLLSLQTPSLSDLIIVYVERNKFKKFCYKMAKNVWNECWRCRFQKFKESARRKGKNIKLKLPFLKQSMNVPH